MTLFEQFKKEMPSNEELIENALNDIVGKGVSKDHIKTNFSKLVDQLNSEIYSRYLEAQKNIGDNILKNHFAKNPQEAFEEMDSFFMSIFQSRKSRAGKVFETIISVLFKKCDYPFDEQVVINGKPDFLMPSEEAYRENPMDCIVFTAKRTLRERWRQIVTEGTKAYGFFLTTLDDDITKAQIEEMRNNKIFIVLPESRKDLNKIYKDEKNVISYEYFFENYLDPAVKRWNN